MKRSWKSYRYRHSNKGHVGDRRPKFKVHQQPEIMRLVSFRQKTAAMDFISQGKYMAKVIYFPLATGRG
jgi:hypothetical protein